MRRAEVGLGAKGEVRAGEVLLQPSLTRLLLTPAG